MKKTCSCIVLICLIFSSVALAQDNRPSCVFLREMDLKPLLGPNHDKPVPFGENACRAESASPGRMVVLTISEGTPAELKNWLAMIKKINTQERSKEVTVSPEPSLGPDAFSVREKADKREIEIYALKGSRAVVVQATWATGGLITDPVFRQLIQIAQNALSKLP